MDLEKAPKEGNMKDVGKNYNDNLCPSCNGETRSIRDISGLAFTTICDNCYEKSFYTVNDSMGCEGCPPYYLQETGKNLKEYGIECVLGSILEKAEEGWENVNGRYYEKYDRIKHTVKNLLIKEVINLDKII